MTIKKLAYPLIMTLTVGACLILGLLSFGGFYSIWPSISLSAITLLLSIAYEGEIYFQNIKQALKKLLTPDFIEENIARADLLKKFQAGTPPEFSDRYINTLKLLDFLDHRPAKALNLLHKEELLTQLNDLEKQHQRQLSQQKPYQAAIKFHRWSFKLIALFSTVCAFFMTLGTSYLLIETFSILPLLSTLPLAVVPAIIAPMAIIAGLAYGLLTFNAITDMVHNNTFKQWYLKLSADIKTHGFNSKNCFLAVSSVLLSLLAIGLTLCTAGTWWSIIKNTPPLFRWMRRMPDFIMGIIHPFIISIASLSFILENTSNSLKMIDELTSSKQTFKDVWIALKKSISDTYQQENFWQFINPARFFILLTITPLRILLFIGHLISIGLTADRVPGLHYIASALIGIISEGFEDLHYFIKPQKDHDLQTLLEERLGTSGGHSHEDDFPTRGLMFVAKPLFALSSYWSTSFRTPMSETQTPSQPPNTNQKTILKRVETKLEHKFIRRFSPEFFKAAAYCIPCDTSQEAKIKCNICP